MTDEDESVARRALEAVSAAHAGEPALVAVVQGLARDHALWSIRLRAVEALVRLGGDDATLAAAVREDPYAFVREAAARGLRARGADATLLAPTVHDPEPRVRAAAGL